VFSAALACRTVRSESVIIKLLSLGLRPDAACHPDPTPATTRNRHDPHSLALFLASKMVAVSGLSWLSLE
ncbi:hypothetical protein ACXM95_001593, partial [Pseudomonas aeruginosa]